MTAAALLKLLEVAPHLIEFAMKLNAIVRDGRGNEPLTPQDWVELERLAGQSGADIFKRAGVTPPV